MLPIRSGPTWDDVKDFCEHVADAMAGQAPDRYVATASKAKRDGLVFVDWPAYEFSDWDYILMRTRPDATGTGAPATVRSNGTEVPLNLVDHRGGWWLYSSRALQ